MTRDEIDALFERHAAAEGRKDVDGIMDTLADGVVHEVVGDPRGVLTDRAAIRERYVELFDGLTEDKFEVLSRYYGENFFIDESHWYGRATGMFLGIPGGNRPVNFRVLHVCELRDGRMSKEQVWLDMAAIMQQLAPAA
ncbi:ester cyclase [Nocardia sp. IFM 10818]